MPNMKDYAKATINHLVDALNKFILIIVIILFIISIFINNFYIDLSRVILFAIFLFRVFSKNRNQREKENQFFIKIINFFKKPFNVLEKNIKDKNHVYKKCLKCKTILKLPLPEKKGLKHAKCPKCGKRVTFFTLKKEKIEIIKKK